MPDLQKSETYALHPRNTAGHAEKAANRNADNAIIRHDDTTEIRSGIPASNQLQSAKHQGKISNG
ncbi:hypothetical protein [Bifidobacterium thermophilum]|uniref:hypothetical protein n=1 Tax=Bifidobacterium thermophilum TaxID=33905 RepID=UPI00117833B0|nr:hypothetical protein [Bifidobacterium thermophilum]